MGSKIDQLTLTSRKVIKIHLMFMWMISSSCRWWWLVRMMAYVIGYVALTPQLFKVFHDMNQFLISFMNESLVSMIKCADMNSIVRLHHGFVGWIINQDSVMCFVLCALSKSPPYSFKVFDCWKLAMVLWSRQHKTSSIPYADWLTWSE